MTINPGTADTSAGPPRRFPFPEVTALFNPALGAMILSAAAAGHAEESDSGLPWFAAFLVIPFVLHDPTRESLPRDIRTSLAAWLARNPVIRDEFDRHANALAPITRRAIRFALRSGMMNLDATRLTQARRIRGLSGASGAEVRPYYSAARLVGRWMARTDVLTAYSLLGVRL